MRVVMSYTTEDGVYGFSIECEEYGFDADWRVYIIFSPFHQGDDSGVTSPRQAVDQHGNRYVDWRRKITSLGDARTVAALWAESDQRFHTQRKRPRTQTS